jgi:long-chain fatty acid transport protein
MRQQTIRVASFVVPLCLISSAALAGGYDIPDEGTEALGRGAAFAAKADDGTALYYNVAGLAQQRGTRVLMDINLMFHDTAFTRAGLYPGDPSDPSTPWARSPYPTIHDGTQTFEVPFFALSSDFNFFKRLTLGFALYGPPGVGEHDYSQSTSILAKQHNGSYATVIAPSPARYDLAHANLLILMPTWGAGFRAAKWLDIGFAVQWVYARFGLSNASLYTAQESLCVGSPDYPGCDSYGQIDASGNTFGLLFSALAHPTGWLDIGLSYRPQIDIHATGNLHGVPPAVSPTQLGDTDVHFNTMLPHMLRAGLRVANHYDDGTEKADLEFDATYENWGATRDRIFRSIDDPSQKLDHIYADQFMLGTGVLDVNLNHGYRDTFSLRLGGAYNWRVSDLIRVILRLGTYLDSAATDLAHTRLDFNTGVKWAFTMGLGYRWKGMTANIAYAFVYSPARDVSNSAETAVSAINGTSYLPGEPMIAVGNGRYEYSMHILSLGLTFNIAEFRKATLLPH